MHALVVHVIVVQGMVGKESWMEWNGMGTEPLVVQGMESYGDDMGTTSVFRPFHRPLRGWMDARVDATGATYTLLHFPRCPRAWIAQLQLEVG